MNRLRGILALTLVCLSHIASAKPPKAKTPKKYHINVASTESDGSVVLHGSTTIFADNLNVVRRGYKIGGVATVTSPPTADLGTLGTPAAPKTSTTDPKQPTKKQTPSHAVVPAQAVPAHRPRNRAGRVTSESLSTVDPKVIEFSKNTKKLLDEVGAYYQQVQNLKTSIDKIRNEENIDSGHIEESTAILRSGATSLASLLDRSDQLLVAVDHPLFDAAVNKLVADGSALSVAYSEDWPVSRQQVADRKAELIPITDQLKTLKAALADSRKSADDLKAGAPPIQHDWSQASLDSYNDAAADLAQVFKILGIRDTDIKPADDDIKRLSTSADSFSPGSTDGLAFDKLHQTLASWYDYLKPLDTALQAYSKRTDQTIPEPKDPLSLSLDVRCENFTAEKTVTVVSLTASADNIVELTPVMTKGNGKSAPATSDPKPTSQKLVTVTCETPIIIAVGVGFSSIPDNEFSIQQIGSTTNASGVSVPTNVFSQTTNSNFHPVPLAAVHTGLGFWGNIPIYASIAIAANIKSQNSGGSGAEYLIGPSIGLFRYSFLTAGLYVGRQTILAAGFKPGDPVPTGVTAPPLSTSYQPGFGLAISFSK
jgi:hypothetical protein